MKKIFLSIFSLLALSAIYAQEPADALRLSFQTGNGGTARNQAIGGAGGSLGGEFSSLFINPAGLGFYKTGDFLLTPGFSMKNNKSTYLGGNGEAQNNSFNMGASGLVFSSPARSNTVRNITVGIGVNRSADFNNQIYYKGLNKNSTYSQKYVDELKNSNTTNPDDVATLFPETSSLAFNTYLISPVYNQDSMITGYASEVNPALGINQQNSIITRGGITDFSIGVGLNLKDKLYLGGSLSFPTVNYERDATYTETNASSNPGVDFNYFESSESLRTKGIGINMKVGVIYKPIAELSLGLGVHTPTFYQLTDDYTTRLETGLKSFGAKEFLFQNSTDLEITDGMPLETRYNIISPWKFMASASYLINSQNTSPQKGFITADVEYVNYASMSFRDADNNSDAKDYYADLNELMSNLYKDAFNVRVGGEVKFNTLAVRLGGAYYGNPYRNEDANQMKVSGGLGYRNKGVFIDLTYVHSLNKDVHYPYRLDGMTNTPAFLKNNAGNIVATIGFKL